MQGYLVTITSEGENDFIAEHTTATNAWIGATDDNGLVNGVAEQRYGDREGDWFWFTGPEAGQEFWNGGSGGSTRNGLFENWASGEPNNEPRNLFDDTGEDFAVTNFNGALGRWNDALNDASGVTAAIIEYGGMPGEPNKAKAATGTETIWHAIAPDAPEIGMTYESDETVSGSITDGAANGSPITNREYSLDGGTTWDDLVVTDDEFELAGLTNGEVYSLCIRTENDFGVSEPSECVEVSPATVPDAPVLDDIRPRDEGLRVTVTPGEFDGGHDVTAWEYTLNDGDWTEFAGIDFDGFLRIETGLTNGVGYEVCVRASNDQGASASSNCLAVTPAGPSAPDLPEISTVDITDDGVSVTVIEPADDGGADIVLFEYSTDDGATWVEAPISPEPLFISTFSGPRRPAAIIVATTHEWLINGLTPGSSYWLRFRVTNDAGYSAISDRYRLDIPGGVLASTGVDAGSLTLGALGFLVAGAVIRRRRFTV